MHLSAEPCIDPKEETRDDRRGSVADSHRTIARSPFEKNFGQWLIAIALFFVTLFLCTRHNDYPYYYEKDAHSKVAQVVSKERNFLHPPLMTNAADLVLRITGKEFTNENAIQAGRFCMAFFTAVAVAAFSLLGFRFWGAAGALCVGGLVMTHPLVFDLSHHFKEDPALIFGLGLSFLSFQIFWEKRSILASIGMGVASALAVSGKYVGAAAIILALILLTFARKQLRPAHWFAFFSALLLTILVVDYQIIQYDRFVSGFKTEMKDLTRKDKRSEVPQFKRVGQALDRHVPPLIGLLVGAYIWYLYSRQRRQPVLWFLLLYPTIFLISLLFSPRLFTRHFLPIFVCTSAMAGMAIPFVADQLRQFLSRFPRVPRFPVFLLSMVLLTAVYLATYHRKLREVYKSYSEPSRDRLIEYINTQLPADAVIAADGRVFLLTPDLQPRPDKTIERKVYAKKRIGYFGTVADLYNLGVTHVVAHATDSRPLAPEEGLSLEKRLERAKANRYTPDFYTELLPLLEPVQEFRGGRSAYISPGLQLYRLKARPEKLMSSGDYKTGAGKETDSPEGEEDEE